MLLYHPFVVTVYLVLGDVEVGEGPQLEWSVGVVGLARGW